MAGTGVPSQICLTPKLNSVPSGGGSERGGRCGECSSLVPTSNAVLSGALTPFLPALKVLQRPPQPSPVPASPDPQGIHRPDHGPDHGDQDLQRSKGAQSTGIDVLAFARCLG